MRLLRMCALVLASAMGFLAGNTVCAQTYQTLFFDNFGSYQLGTLDKNDTMTPGPNQAPNGSGNPWFGQETTHTNLVVVGPENGVNPISGLRMIRGNTPARQDQNWYNLAYRLNQDPSTGLGAPFTGNIMLDWWFYDPLDPNDPTSDPTSFRDYVALAYYDTAPLDRDGPDNLSSWSLNTGVVNIQRLSLGASSVFTGAYDPTLYQARIVGNNNANFGAGWYNTATPRSKGWHHGMIIVGPLLADGTNEVSFFIDDLTNPTVDDFVPAAQNFGYNIIEINANAGTTAGYYSAVNFSLINP